MTATELEKKTYGTDVKIMNRESDFTVYKIKDKSGEVVMTSYRVFPGIELIYNDVHMQSCDIDADPPENMLEINHCREGRIECKFDNGECLYLSKGDLSIHIKNEACSRSYFPLNHYHGISVVIDLVKAQEHLTCILDEATASLDERQRMR